MSITFKPVEGVVVLADEDAKLYGDHQAALQEYRVRFAAQRKAEEDVVQAERVLREACIELSAAKDALNLARSAMERRGQ